MDKKRETLEDWLCRRSQPAVGRTGSRPLCAACPDPLVLYSRSQRPVGGPFCFRPRPPRSDVTPGAGPVHCGMRFSEWTLSVLPGTHFPRCFLGQLRRRTHTLRPALPSSKKHQHPCAHGQQLTPLACEHESSFTKCKEVIALNNHRATLERPL